MKLWSIMPREAVEILPGSFQVKLDRLLDDKTIIKY